MKRLLLSSLFIGALALAGCSNDKTAEADTPTVAKATNYLDDYVDNPQVTSDAKLHKKGDEARSKLGVTRVVNAKEIQQELQVGPMKIVFHNVKQLSLEPGYSMIDYFHFLDEREKFDIIKTFVTVENTSKKKVHFSPISTAKVSTGEKWNWEREVYLDNLNADYKPGEKKLGNIGFILKEKSQPTSFTIETSDAFNMSKKSIAKAKSITIK